MSNINLLSYRIEKINRRLSLLYQNVNGLPSSQVELMPKILLELGFVSEALQVVMRELTEQNEKFTVIQGEIEAERQRYQNLFELVPDAYLVTDTSFSIQEANRAAINLLNTQQQLLIGRSLIELVHVEDRPLFKTKLSQRDRQNPIELSVRLQQERGKFLDTTITTTTTRNWKTDSEVWHWLLRPSSEREPKESNVKQVNYDLFKNRPLCFYERGEIIPLEPDQIWLISKGAVKLTTLSDRCEDMLIGLVRDGMIFGSSLTALPTYQATVLSDVQLASIQFIEISQSPCLAQALFPLIAQRLRQTESFLSIYGQIRVEDRLNHLLTLLKQEIGEPVKEGIRFCIRLTHQDFASVCCTTRVTITRILGKLQQEGKITFDSCNHLIVKENF
ncbi:PAS domain-containing protein [Pleurocapsales cyanobacterium LEGE 06147]|nr:PAS domain-containing protein [Pleurocapsales cyanobacterium LEGE 06147]